MNEKIISMLIGILIMLGGWSLAKTFTLSTTQAVLDDKVDKLERHVEKLQTQMDNMINMDEEIMEQHENLFRQLENNQSSSGYNYGYN
jgi:peptidoglycan hydrolase CwlO-like protein|tara:strand:+ start:588 stop:851 length:264 start_codon:yes stop_codon:yes gene_type:complete